MWKNRCGRGALRTLSLLSECKYQNEVLDISYCSFRSILSCKRLLERQGSPLEISSSAHHANREGKGGCSSLRKYPLFEILHEKKQLGKNGGGRGKRRVTSHDRRGGVRKKIRKRGVGGRKGRSRPEREKVILRRRIKATVI